MSAVSRRGTVVLRTAGPWSPTVHRLLEQLRERGVPGVPEPLGFDPDGRERIEFQPGEVPSYPLPGWVWSDDVLREVTTRLAAIHAASADFDLVNAVWQLPSREPVEVLCHNDLAPYNLVFNEDHRLSGVIDWDTASPGPRIWDLAYLAYRLVPLVGPDYPDAPLFNRVERTRRLDLLIESYGQPFEPADLVTTALDRVRALADFTAARVDPARNSLARHMIVYRADIAWLEGEVAAGVRRSPNQETAVATTSSPAPMVIATRKP